MSYDKDSMSTAGPGGDHEELSAEVAAGGDKVDIESLLTEETSPIDELKAIVMSLDWEISDQTMDEFSGEIKKLKELWGDEKVPLTLLKILGALGGYIKAAKDLVHPDSVKLLHSVYNNLEKVVITPGIPEYEKQQIIISEFAKYNELKEELRRLKVAAFYESVGKRFNEISAAESGDTTNIQGPEAAPKESVVPGADLEEEVGADGGTYAEIELTPGVDGIMDKLSSETSNSEESIETTRDTGPEGVEIQVIASNAAGQGEDSVQAEKEIAVERVDDSFAEVDQRLDDFFYEDDVFAVAPLGEKGAELVEPESEALVMLAVDEESDGDSEAPPVVELSLVADESVSAIAQSLDDFFADDQAVVAAPIGEGGELGQPESEAVVMLAVDDEVDGGGGAAPAFELSPVADVPASAIAQSLDDFFAEDEGGAAVPIGEGGEHGEPEPESFVLLAVADELDADEGADAVIELHQLIEEPSSAPEKHFDESLRYDEAFPEQDGVEPHDEQVQPVAALKTIILSINRQLSEQSLQDLNAELIRLKALWESEKVLLMFLHFLESLGNHLQAMGEHMQPNTTQLLSSISSKLEKAAAAQRNDITQHGMLLEAIKLYIKWNEKNIGAVLLPEQKDHEPVQDMILLGPAEEVNILEPID